MIKQTNFLLSCGGLTLAIALSPLVVGPAVSAAATQQISLDEGQPKPAPGQIVSLTLQPSPALTSRPVTLTVNGTGRCQVAVTVRTPDNSTWGLNLNGLPVTFNSLTFVQPGSYQIIATPGARGCSGKASYKLAVLARPTQKAGGIPGPGDRQRNLPGATDLCKEGFVWREAVPNIDRVCVTPQTRDMTRADNALATQRRVPGSDTCKQGFVWREALPNDHVCVTPETRKAAADDNGHAAERRIIN